MRLAIWIPAFAGMTASELATLQPVLAAMRLVLRPLRFHVRSRTHLAAGAEEFHVAHHHREREHVFVAHHLPPVDVARGFEGEMPAPTISPVHNWRWPMSV